MKKLNEIQQKLKAPKGQRNSFGNYNYRSCEDILEAVKPLLGEAILTINDEIVNLGERFYVKATATLKDGKDEISVSAFARESLVKKGMDESQITGATSSYARKYALNGLFCIDDTKDADTMDNTKVAKKTESPESAVCSICGKTMFTSKKGNLVCPDWMKHKDNNEGRSNPIYSEVQGKVNQQQKDFLGELDGITYDDFLDATEKIPKF